MSKKKSFQNRFLQSGLSSFSNIEKLEFLLSLKSDNEDHYNLAKNLTNRYKSLNNIIDESDFELQKVSGLESKHLIGLKLPYHFSNLYLFEKAKMNPVASSPQATYNYLIHSMRGKKNEQFNVLYLNNRNEIITDEVLFNGTVNSACIFPREIIKSAFKHNATSLILAHNHPSGNLNPSDIDITMTKRINDITKLLDINVLDHIIVAGDKYFSFSEEGIL